VTSGLSVVLSVPPRVRSRRNGGEEVFTTGPRGRTRCWSRSAQRAVSSA